MKLGIGFLLLAIATVVLHVVPPTWQAQPVDALVKHEAASEQTRWSLSPNARVGDPETKRELILSARGIDRFASAQFVFTPADGLDHVFVEVESRANALRGQGSLWPQVGVLLHALDKDGKRLGYWPYRAAGRNGDHDWTQIQGLWPVAQEAVRVRAIAYLLADEGSVRMRSIQLQGGKTRQGYKVAYYLLVLAWLLFGVYSARQALTGSGRRALRVATITLAAALIVAGVAPQPYMYETVRSVTFMAQDAADSMVFKWHALTSWVSDPESPSGAKAPPGAQTTPPASEPDQASGKRTGGNTELARDGEINDKSGATLTPPDVKTPRQTKPKRQHYWEPDFPLADKAAHMGAFLLLAICALVAWPTTRWFVCVASAAGVSITIQLLQTMTVTRQFDWWDFAADLTGILAGAASVRLISIAFASSQPRTHTR